MLPRVQILQALKQTLESDVPNHPSDPARNAWKVRHHRNRDTREEEMPCLAIRYMGEDISGVTNGADDGLSLGETVIELHVDLVIDSFIEPEHDRETAGDATDGLEPTGLEQGSEIIEKTLDTIFKAGEEINTMGGLIWDARYDGTGDTDDVGTPDIARSTERLTLLYRVRSEAPHVLLLGE